MSIKLVRARALGLVLGVFALSAGLAAASSSAANGRAALAGSVPTWAKSSNFKGAAASSESAGFRVYLGWRNESAVKALAKAVSNPSSSSYGHYLTPQQFRHQRVRVLETVRFRAQDHERKGQAFYPLAGI